MAFRLIDKQILSELIAREKVVTCGMQSRQRYSEMHKARFADTLRLCQTHVREASARTLDIGRSELTAVLKGYYSDVHTLGLDPASDDGGHREESGISGVPHITFDLLNSPMISTWPECGRFNLIVFSEVLEHLWVAPEFVLAFLKHLLADGGILICTTPNAADISKRIRLAFGHNPNERLRLHAANPGHIREYTSRELSEIGRRVALGCINQSYFNWVHAGRGNQVKKAVVRLLRRYPAFRSSQVCVFSAQATSAET
jgi:SAM-dependent methyltransferase